MAKRSEKKKAVERADTNFAVYIKLKYSNDEGFANCFTCGGPMLITDRNCNLGHFMGRRSYSTRWHRNNGRVQCVPCNNWGGGQTYEFGKRLDREEEGLADKMYIESKKSFWGDAFEINYMAEEYKKEAEKLLENKTEEVKEWAARKLK